MAIKRVGVVRAKGKVIQEHLKAILGSSDFYNHCQRVAGGGTKGNVSSTQIMNYKIPLPSIEKQKEILS